jgi:alpha-1,3-rhamnosyl/mannosyltransferase
LASSLRVALDATPLCVPASGIRRYTSELARALAVEFPHDEYFLFSDQPFEMPCALPNLHRGENRGGRRWWSFELPRALRRCGIDVFHGCDFAVPYVPLCPAVMTVHDLSPWRAETAASTSARVRRRTPVLLRLGLATMVITPSEAVRQEAIAHFGLAPGRVVAVPLAASELFRPVAPAGRERPYFLCVGTDPRKNLSVVVDAWRELQKTVDVELVIVGRGYREGIADAELPALYSGAVAFLYPTLYEGFGLPVLEAMQCGTMVVASNDAAVREVAGGAAVHVDARDGRGWLEAMRAALDAEWRARWRERSVARAAEFSWKRTARGVREVYESAVRGG